MFCGEYNNSIKNATKKGRLFHLPKCIASMCNDKSLSITIFFTV